MIIGIGIATFIATLLGGLFAIHLKDRLHLILGFSAGAVIGVAFFDLMPEAFELGMGAYGAQMIAGVIALGFLLYLTLDRMVMLHLHDHEGDDPHVISSGEQARGAFGAGTLSIHSLLDGIGIGLAFKVSNAVGIVVAVAVLTHDFSDGINTVSFIMKHHGDKARAFRWLLIDALTPLLGIVATMFFTVSDTTLGLLLALFTGFFLYIGPSDLLPESHHEHPVQMTTVMTLLGAGTLYLIIRLATLLS